MSALEREIYLDNSATTPLCDVAVEAINKAIKSYANPSSLHALGLEAHKLIDDARSRLLSSLGLSADRTRRVIFTSGGSEANNLAVFGVIRAKNFKFLPQIITTDSEHPSLLEPITSLEKDGLAEVIKLPTTNGKIDISYLSSIVCERTVLVSIMSVNNETGAIYDVKNAFDTVKRINPATVTHTDAVQAFLKTNVNFRALKADLITVSGHKINAPKGVGALIVSGDIIKAKKLVPTLLGGGQEGNFRSGTENVLGISALGAAAQYNKEKLSSFIEKTSELSELLISLLPDSVKVNRPEMHAPHIVSITLPAIKSETALHFLSGKGIYVSSGSACASNGRHKSHVLVAYGLSDLDTDCTLRVSLSDKVSEDDIRYTAEMIGEAVRTLVKIG